MPDLATRGGYVAQVSLYNERGRGRVRLAQGGRQSSVLLALEALYEKLLDAMAERLSMEILCVALGLY
jgi:hypothetical protein